MARKVVNKAEYGQLSLFSQSSDKRSMNSGFVGEDDCRLAEETRLNGYDLDRPARVYSVSRGGRVQNLWIMTTRDAMRVCSHPKSKGRRYGGEWFYCWTQHDIGGNLEKNRVAHFKDDGRLKTFEGIEDIKILRSFI